MKKQTVINYCTRAEERFGHSINRKEKKFTTRATECRLFYQAWNDNNERLDNFDKQKLLHPAGESMNGHWQEKFDGTNTISYFENITTDSLESALKMMIKAEPQLREYDEEDIKAIYIWNFANNVLPKISKKRFDDLHTQCCLIGLNIKEPKWAEDKIGIDAYDEKRDTIIQSKSNLKTFKDGINKRQKSKRQMKEYRELAANHKEFLFFDEKTGQFFDINFELRPVPSGV